MPKTAKTKVVDEDIELKEKEDGEPVEMPKKEKKVEKKVYSDHDLILCHSVTAGTLYVDCRSGNNYEFVNYGAETEIEYKDLVDLIRRHSENIFMPRIIIDDKDFLAEFRQVVQTYEGMYDRGDLKEILRLPAEQLASVISQLPEGIQNTLRSLAATMVGNGEIDSLRTVKELEKIFGADFNLLSELFSSK